MHTTIVQAHYGPRLEDARRLFGLYAKSLGFSLDFQGFDAELAGLPGKYAPEGGSMLVALVGDEPAGCVALRPLEQPGVCEMKRLFVVPGRRASGLGRDLALAAIDLARTLGYAAMRLDTLTSMVSANRLYDALGFREIPPYCANPFANARFLELSLGTPAAEHEH